MVFLGRLIRAYLRALQLAPDPTAAGAEERPAGGACAEGQAGTGHGNLRLRSHRAPGNRMQGLSPMAGPRISLGNGALQSIWGFWCSQARQSTAASRLCGGWCTPQWL